MPLKTIDKDIRKLMKRFGTSASWYPSRLCSCVGRNNGSFELGHTCNQGFYYATPVTVQLIRTQISQRTLNSPQGRIFNGGATFTIPKNVNGIEQRIWEEIAHGDIIVIPNKSRRDTDILLRGVRDKLQAFDVSKILNVYKDETQYLEGTDFNVSGNDIVWVDTKGPGDGENYSVEFLCSHQYRIWEDAATSRGTSEDDLPKRVQSILRRYVNPATNVMDTYNFEQEIY